jgi:hypothetical protein
MVEPADEGLHVEDLTEQVGVDSPAQRQEVAVPPAALVHGDGAVHLGGGGEQQVGIGGGEAHRLLDHHVLAGAAERAVRGGPGASPR